MPKIKSPESFQPNVVLTASDLQNHVDGSYPLPGFITEQASIDAVSGDDSLIIHDQSVEQLRKVTLSQVFLGAFPIVTNSVTGTAGSNLSIVSQTGRSINITSGDSIAFNSVNPVTFNGNVSIDGKLTASGTGALKIPVGTTAQRPSTPVAGDIRYNSTNDQAEVYSGSEWKAVGGSPFDASGGTVTTIDGYKIHTFTSSGTFTPALNREGKIEYLVVGAGGSGAYNSIQGGGGGGGGDVKTGFITIAKNTSPITVTVGTNVSGNGNPSSFSTITANGGTAGSGRSGGTSGSGNVGGGPSDGGGAGGGAMSGEQYPRGVNLGGIGGKGIGSSISGFYKEYGGGGAGAGKNGLLEFFPTPSYGGGSRDILPVANSGGGGSGGCGGYGATSGADGVVIIRYRVS